MWSRCEGCNANLTQNPQRQSKRESAMTICHKSRNGIKTRRRDANEGAKAATSTRTRRLRCQPRCKAGASIKAGASAVFIVRKVAFLYIPLAANSPLNRIFFAPSHAAFSTGQGRRRGVSSTRIFLQGARLHRADQLFKHAAPSAAKAKQASTLLQKRNNAAFAVGHVAQPAAPAKPFPQKPRASSQISCVYSSKCPDAQKREPRM